MSDMPRGTHVNAIDSAGRWAYGVWCTPHDCHPSECFAKHYPTAQSDHEALWQSWAAGESRCPYCIDNDEHFHSQCDCSYHDKVCRIAGCLGK